MKKLLMATAACALIVGLVAVPAAAVKSTKQVGGTVSVFVTPNPVPTGTTAVTATGNVGSNSGCRKDRTVHFAYIDSTTLAVTPLATTAETGPNGDYTAVLPAPTSASVLRATVEEQLRKVGGKRKKGKKDKPGRKFNCLEIIGQSGPVTLSPPA
jgi:uncharacterized membrane protein